MVIVASLGPQVRSITYRAPDGTLHTQLSHSQDGIFLLVFPVDRATCGYYLGGRLTRSGACERSDRPRPAGPRDPLTAAIKAIHLTDGKSCAVRGLSLLGNCPIR